MTVPFERTRALLDVQLFLLELTDPALTPRVSRALRGKAVSLLKHYPMHADIEQAHKALPDCFGPVPPFWTRAELAAELVHTSKPLKEIGGSGQTSKGGDLPGDESDDIPRKTGARNGD